MRKTLLLMASLLCGLGAGAQTYSIRQATVSNGPKPMVQRPTSLKKVAGSHVLPGKLSLSKAATSDAPITTTPEGRLVDNMYVSSSAYGMGYGNIYSLQVDGGLGAVVEGTDGAVYVQNPISQAYVWALGKPWIKCDKAKGDTLVMATPQPYCIDGGDTYYIQRLKLSADSTTYVTDSANTNIRFVWRNDTLRQIDDCYAGLVSADGSWFYMGDNDMLFTVNPDKPASLPGAELEATTLEMSYLSDPSDFSKTSKTNVTMYAQSNDDEDGGSTAPTEVYLTHLESALPNVPIKCSITDLEGDGALEIAGRQYLGVDENYNSHVYALPCKARVDSTGGTPFFNYDILPSIKIAQPDEDNDTIKADYPSSLVINCGKNRLYTINEYVAPKFIEKVYNAAVPADPVFSKDIKHLSRFDVLYFDIPTVDTEGKDLNPNDLYYEIYCDGQPYTFTTTAYTGLSTDMTELPYDFQDNSNYDILFSDGSVTIYFYNQNYDSVGVQSIYKAGGVVNRSNIVYKKNPASTGISTPNEQAESVLSESYFDLLGRQCATQPKGVSIRRMELADGSVHMVKVAR